LERSLQSLLLVITASTLTRSQVGLSRTNVAELSEPEEQPQIAAATAANNK
jgi:hypothetical protein